MPSNPLTIQPIEHPFDVTFPDVNAPGGGIPPIPGSKSLTNRALLLAALADGKSTLTGVLFSDDTRVMMKALRDLGFTLDIDEPNTTVTVQGQAGKIPTTKANLHLGNAGTAMRFLTAACCLGEPGSVYTLDGIPRMRERPIGELVEPLRQLGAKIDYLGNDGFPPLRIHACGLAGGQLKMEPTLSSQFISALLQIGPCLQHGLTIDFKGPLTSEPYVRMTLKLISMFGADTHDYLEMNQAVVNTSGYTGLDYTIEPDASNASYFLAAASAIPGSQCNIKTLGSQSLQGDIAFGGVLNEMGAAFEVSRSDVCVSSTSSSRLRGVTLDLNHIPDAAMTIATLAILAQGPTTIRNVGNWRVKETDRMAAMQTELTKLGATVTVLGDDITITPPPNCKIIPAAIDTYDDHRMAMAFAVIGLAQPGVTINDPDCVNKTFPDFFKYLGYLRQPPISPKK
jgi:3-phosphoshikimate 1-carboxyvinyltransferase